MSTKETNPHHYQIILPDGRELWVADIIEALFIDDAHLSQATKYLLRAGRKASSTYLKDVGKCLWWCARAIMFRKGHIDLPPKVRPQDVSIGGSPIKTGTRKK